MALGLSSIVFFSNTKTPRKHHYSLPKMEDVIIPHPLGVKPAGNALTASWSLHSAMGFLGTIPDELVMTLLEYLDSTALLALGATCRGLYAFTHAEEVWRPLFIEYASMIASEAVSD